MTKIIKRIELPSIPPRGYHARLMLECNTNRTTVTQAMRHNVDTPKCREIREAYARIYGKVVLEEVEFIEQQTLQANEN